MFLLPGFFEHARKLGYELHWIVGILVIQLMAVVFEGIGIGIALPILQYMNSGGDTAKLATGSRLWEWMLAVTRALGLPLNLLTLLVVAFLVICLRQVFMYARDLSITGAQF
jgi:hypothetical protein